MRLDIGAALKAALRPQRLFRNFAISLGLLLVLQILLFNIVKWCGIPDEMLPLITWYSVARRVRTTIWICVLLGFTAPIAMEIVLLTNLLAPFCRPLSWRISARCFCACVLSNIVSPDFGYPLGSGLLLALLAKYTLGEDRIEKAGFV